MGQLSNLINKEMARREVDNPVSIALKRARSDEREPNSPLRNKQFYIKTPSLDDSEAVNSLRRKVHD